MKKFNKSYILGISMVSALGGLLFGYDWVVIGGAKPFYERFFEIAGSPTLQAWAMPHDTVTVWAPGDLHDRWTAQVVEDPGTDDVIVIWAEAVTA